MSIIIRESMFYRPTTLCRSAAERKQRQRSCSNCQKETERYQLLIPICTAREQLGWAGPWSTVMAGRSQYNVDRLRSRFQPGRSVSV